MRGFVRKSSLLVMSFLFLAYLAIFLSIEARGGYQLGSKLADPSYAYQLTFDQTKKLLAQLPISGKTLIERVGNPNICLRQIRHWRGYTFESAGGLEDPPLWQWPYYRGFERTGLLCPAIALFDPPAEQWWYFDGRENETSKAYWFLISKHGLVVDWGVAYIPLCQYPDWKTFP